MSNLESNHHVAKHLEELRKHPLVTGISDNGVLFQIDNEMTEEMQMDVSMDPAREHTQDHKLSQ